MDYQIDETIFEAIGALNNDEHIYTAIKSGIIDHALIIAHAGKETPISNEEKKLIDELHSKESIAPIINGIYHITPEDERTYPESEVYFKFTFQIYSLHLTFI